MFAYWMTLHQWLSHHSLLPAASRAHVIPKIKGTGCEALPRWMEGTQDVLRGVGALGPGMNQNDGGFTSWTMSQLSQLKNGGSTHFAALYWLIPSRKLNLVKLKDGERWMLTNLFEQESEQEVSQSQPAATVGKVEGLTYENCRFNSNGWTNPKLEVTTCFFQVNRVAWLDQQRNGGLTNEQRTIRIKWIMLASQAESWVLWISFEVFTCLYRLKAGACRQELGFKFTRMKT